MDRSLEQDDDAPFPLSELKQRISQKTYEWLQKSEEEEAAWKANVEETNFLFHTSSEDEEYYQRVQEWCSSLTKVDGIGGYFTEDVDQEVKVEDGALRVKYILSDAGGGHGDDLWAASRYVSNILADDQKCRDILKPLLENTGNNSERNLLLGLNMVELGAGAGLPSWTAMHCGARVVSTDQAIPDRIRCMAECAERNLRHMKSRKDTLAVEGKPRFWNNAESARVCPCNWGDDEQLDEVINLLNNEGKQKEGRCLFDVLIAADCIYIPESHGLLLESIDKLLSEPGLALLPFALHGNTKDEIVWNIISLAKERGFDVDILEKKQLTPQSAYMDTKRALVHMLRLRRGC